MIVNPTITFTGVDEVKQELERVPRIIRGHVARRIHKYSNDIIANIRADHKLFKYKNADATYNRGKLKQSLWTDKLETSDDDLQVQQIGWAVPYGDVLEYGPMYKKQWEIKPKGFRSDVGGAKWRSGGMQALRFLRFNVGGKIVYARKVTHKWTKKELRPHVKPHVEKLEKKILKDLQSIPAKVFEGKLR